MHRWSLVPTLGRDPHQPGRSATPLELFFDLVFVVAVSLAAQNLHHFISEDHVGTGISRFAMMFFAIWWAWMNFTWYATEFAQEDWLYRLLSLIQMAGALVFAAGVPNAMNDLDFRVAVLGYVIMRLAMSVNWFRVARGTSENAAFGKRYAIGIIAVQGLWILFLTLPESIRPVIFLIFALFELLVPAIAERGRSVMWHPHHVAERYGLFTIIVLGESILASALAIVHAIESGHHYADLILLSITAFIIVACMWWIYFAFPQAGQLDTQRKAFLWGYGHYFIFGTAAAFSAGIEVAIDRITDSTHVSATLAALAVCGPVALFVFICWALLIRGQCSANLNIAMSLAPLAIILLAFVPGSMYWVALVMVGIAVAINLEPVEAPEVAIVRAGVERTSSG